MTYRYTNTNVPADRNFTDIEGPDGMVSHATVLYALQELHALRETVIEDSLGELAAAQTETADDTSEINNFYLKHIDQAAQRLEAFATSIGQQATLSELRSWVRQAQYDIDELTAENESPKDVIR